MKVFFAGVGEAFDEDLANTCLFVVASDCGKRRTILVDCGFTAAAAFFGCAPIPEDDRRRGPDMVWISHFHGDHFFGLPFLLARLWENGRTGELRIIGPPGVAGAVKAALELSYPHLRAKFAFNLVFHELKPGRALVSGGLTLRGEYTGHGAPCLGLRLDDDAGGLYYGGDGPPGERTAALAMGCRCLVQEAYSPDRPVPGHGCAARALALGRETGAEVLALVHVRRQVRRERAEEMRALLAASGVPRAVLPEPGDVLEF